MKRLFQIGMLALFVTSVQAGIIKQNLNFSAQNQSMWGTGTGVLPTTARSQASWNSGSTFGGIVGQVSTVSIPAQYAPVPYWVPPSNCKTRVLEICIEYKNKGHWSTYQQKVPGTGVNYTTDTRSGAALQVSTSGHVGVQSDIGFDGGSVDSSLGFSTTLLTPDNLHPGEFFNINGGASLTSGSVSTQFPKLTGSISASFGIDLRATATGCVLAAGCSSSTSILANLDTGNMKLVDINTINLTDKTALFGLNGLAFDITQAKVNADLLITATGPAVSISLPGLSLTGAGVNLATLDLNYPDLRTNGSLKNGAIQASGTANNLVALTADLDGVALLNGLPTLTGVVANAGSWPASMSFRGDLLDLSVGPTLDVSQTFGLESNLMVDLAFSKSVYANVGNGNVRQINSWSGLYSDIPDLMLGDLGPVDVTPTFWLENWLSNTTTLDIDISGFADVMKGSLSLGGIPVLNGSLMSKALPFPITSTKVFDDRFMLSGYTPVAGKSFVLKAKGIPEPPSLALVILGILGIFAGRTGNARNMPCLVT